MSVSAGRPFHSPAGNMPSLLRVLVLDRTPAGAEMILRELRSAGYHCQAHIVAKPKEFLARLERLDCDIVLSDYHLPGWTGLDALALMRRAGRELPFILVTEMLGEEVAVECLKQGVTDYVLKDHLARLPVVVARALEEKSLRDARSFMVEALQQSEASFRFLFDNNPFPMFVFDLETLLLYQANDAAVRSYGYNQVEFLRLRFGDLHPPEEVFGLIRNLRENQSDGKPVGQWHHRLKGGGVIDVEIFSHRMEYNGRPAALVVAQDITERKRAEHETQKFFTLVENSRDFIGVADLDGNTLYINPAGRALLGIGGASAVKQMRIQRYVAQEDLQALRDTVVPALFSKGQWQGELRFRHCQTGEPIPMDCMAFLVKDLQTGEPRLLATVSRDITERRALERQLQHAQKFEVIGQLAGGIAHDFNNVIGAILGWSELGEEQAAPKDADLASYFKKIHVQCARATALTRQLLAFARRQILEPRNLNLNQSVHEVLNLLDKVIGKDIEIRTALAADLATVRGDPTHIEQVLTNLCINSRDAMPSGGVLSIGTRNVEFTPEECGRDSGLQPGRFVELVVRDTGIGMDTAVRERIFEPFFTTKETGKGTGLGLATVYGIVKQHSGFILVDSAPNQGSTFRILLPVHNDVATVESRTPARETQPVRGGRETILIAEDHEGVREMACATLESLGYRILQAHDGEEAVEIFSANQDSIALVILDVIMPRRGGREACAAITALKPGVPVIFATGYSSEIGALTEMLARGIIILQKPYSPAVLGRKIREVLDHAMAARSPIA
jgi:PAS domain S-box-containing protein